MEGLRSRHLSLSFHLPLDGFYRGTRFDRGGVFSSLLFRGVEMAGSWFERYDPLMHDAVQGPAEEFSPIGYDAAAPGGTFVKIGVGLLRRPDDAPYDRFQLYEIVDPGRWAFSIEGERAVFRHFLEGWYDYRKEIVLTGDSSFEIRHALTSFVPELSGEVYNHNFFTFGKMEVGPSREIDFPFAPAGSWRAVYDSVGFTTSGVRFSRTLSKGESVYCGDIHQAGCEGMPYDLILRETSVMPDLIGHPRPAGDGVLQTASDNYFSSGSPKNHFSSAPPSPLSVRIRGDVPVTHTVLWANHRIACLEPYNAFRAISSPSFHGLPVESPFRWTIRYELF